MTIHEAISAKCPLPKEIWNGKVHGPISYDDEMSISFWYQEHRNGPIVRMRIRIVDYEIVQDQE